MIVVNRKIELGIAVIGGIVLLFILLLPESKARYTDKTTLENVANTLRGHGSVSDLAQDIISVYHALDAAYLCIGGALAGFLDLFAHALVAGDRLSARQAESDDSIHWVALHRYPILHANMGAEFSAVTAAGHATHWRRIGF